MNYRNAGLRQSRTDDDFVDPEHFDSYSLTDNTSLPLPPMRHKSSKRNYASPNFVKMNKNLDGFGYYQD
jgi:hypothetical protein